MNTSEFATTASSIGLAGTLVGEAIRIIPPHQWLERPARSSNHVLWLVGHLATTRALVVQALSEGSVKPELDPLFAGGIPLQEDSRYPAPADVADVWSRMAVRLDGAMKGASSATLSRPVPRGGRSFDGTIGGMLAAAAFHEAYHVGQLGYLTRWLGHPSLLEALQLPQ
jgi:DinB superfamily